MQRAILSSLFVLVAGLSTAAQSYVGSYRAVFISLFSTASTVTSVEFEVAEDGSVTARAGGVLLRGRVGKDGRFEASAPRPDGSTLILRGRFGKDNKASLVTRESRGSGLNRSVAETAVEGTFSPITKASRKPGDEAPPNAVSGLALSHTDPIFEDLWTEANATISRENGAVGTIWRIDASFDDGAGRARRLSILTRQSLPSESKWTTGGNDVTFAAYRESDRTANRRNAFSNGLEVYKTTESLAGGVVTIEPNGADAYLVRLKNFRIKRLGKDDWVEINGEFRAVVAK